MSAASILRGDLGRRRPPPAPANGPDLEPGELHAEDEAPDEGDEAEQ